MKKNENFYFELFFDHVVMRVCVELGLLFMCYFEYRYLMFTYSTYRIIAQGKRKGCSFCFCLEFDLICYFLNLQVTLLYDLISQIKHIYFGSSSSFHECELSISQCGKS